MEETLLAGSTIWLFGRVMTDLELKKSKSSERQMARSPAR